LLVKKKEKNFNANFTFAEYEIIKELGRGGFGTVVLGVHKLTKEKVAIKIQNSGNQSKFPVI
jgi:serine/threonine protein kinase